MKAFGFFGLDDPYTLAHWRTVLSDAAFLQSTINTFIIGLGAAAVGTTVAALVAYVAVRTRYRLRAVLDVLSWLPASIPGIILGLGFLWMFLTVPLFSPLYGTVGVLIVTVALASLTTGVQLLKTNMLQLGRDLEEASSVAGASWAYTFRRIVVPMLGHALLSVAILIFAVAARNVANVAMIVTARNRPLAMLQVEYMVDGVYEPAAVVGVIIVAITCSVAGMAVLLARRVGLRL
jgi:iron(III) transport system permease protein